ncbi:MAG: hypothetical protein JWM28_1814 [Chitinophagaceae bacterium]|nr:hypothetical protein [Chitinophagaceae bacterium]
MICIVHQGISKLIFVLIAAWIFDTTNNKDVLTKINSYAKIYH